MSWKGAFLYSALLHIGLFSCKLPGLVLARQTPHPLEIAYLPVVKVEVAEPAASPTPQPAQIQASPRAAPPLSAPIRPVVPPAPPPRREALLRSVPPPRLQPVLKEAVVSPPRDDAVHLPEGEFAALDHQEQVREHLRRRLLYPAGGFEGVVRLRISLNAQGILKEAAVLESSNPELARVALEDARAAVPYPVFPRPMEKEKQRADYEFLVQYRSE